MMKSIKIKFFLIFTITFIMLIILFITINNSFLEKYYVYSIEKDFIEYYEEIVEYESIDRLLRNLFTLTRSEGIYSMVIDMDDNVVFDSLQAGPAQPNKSLGFEAVNPVPSYIREIVLNNENFETDQYYYNTVEAEDNINDVVYVNTFQDEYYIVMYKAIENINTNADVANRFFIFVSIGLVIIGSFVMFIFAKRITEPIVELKEITEQIAHQNFSHKFKITTDDEIGQLGTNINEMSHELDKAMTSLKEDIKRKEAIDNMRKRFISNVSHELKTPIGIIKGYVEGIKYDVYDSEQEKALYYDVIINETDKMNAMLGQLLALSTMESEVDKINLTVFNVAVLIDEVELKYRRVFEDKGIIFVKDAVDDVFIKADYMKFDQVVTNYVNNAINHVDESKEICLSLRKEKGKAVVSVFNTGPNIPLSESENIWENFYKIDKARSREYGGTGLGLSIVRVIMEKHNGQYGYVNHDNGVEFWAEVEAYEVEESEG